MPKFQGSGFSVELPEGTVDASSYAFAFPRDTEFAPTLVIRFERPQQKPDLAAAMKEYILKLREGVERLELVSELPVKARGSWEYTISVIEWGPSEARMRQKQIFIFVPGAKPTLFVLIGTDLASQFGSSERRFDQIIRTFDPNAVQLI